MCSILKTAVDYLWQFTKIERPLDKSIGGGGGENGKKDLGRIVQKAGTTPRDARHAEANEVSFLLRDRLGMYNREDFVCSEKI